MCAIVPGNPRISEHDILHPQILRFSIQFLCMEQDGAEDSKFRFLEKECKICGHANPVLGLLHSNGAMAALQIAVLIP